MNQINRVIKFQNYDIKKSIIGFWGTILLVNILTYASNLYYSFKISIDFLLNKDIFFPMVAINYVAIFIYFVINWIVMYYENFALALNFGVTRREFYKSIIINNVIVALIFSTIQGVLQIIDKNIVETLEYKPLVEFGLFNTTTDNIFFIILALFIAFSTIISIANLMGILQFKFGYKFWIGLSIAFILSQVLYNNILKQSISIFIGNSLIFITLISVIIICYILGYLLIMKSSVKK